MFVFLAAVPALLVVVLGYVAGYGLWTWIGGMADAAFGTSLVARAEAVGWITGLLALACVARWSIRWWRGRTRRQ